MKIVPCCYYPTTVAFIDDDVLFLRNISAERDLKSLPYQNFTDPHKAVEHLNHDTYLQDFMKRTIKYVEEAERGEESLGMYFSEIIHEVFNQQRYNQVSVAVIDYDMPSMNGLQVCERIENPYIRKILLTGAATENLAIEAFNKGLIYQFIPKQLSTYPEKLYQVIEQAQQSYFAEMSQLMLKALKQRPGSTALIDPTFAQYFHKLVEANHIQEYYLVEPMGTFFMIDEHQKRKCLFTLTDDMIETNVTTYEDSLTPESIEKLKQRKAILCLSDPFDLKGTSQVDTNRYLQTSHKIQGQKETYYTYYGDNLIAIEKPSSKR
jgi:CheY-like chemotaxis protein